MRNIIFKIIKAIFRLLPIDNHKIVFISHLGKNFSCNPKYLCNYILSNHSSKFKIIFAYDSENITPREAPKGTIPTNINSKKFLYEISTCKFLVSNTRIPIWFNFDKRRKQKYIQTWHSSLRLKMIEKDANLGTDYENFAKIDSSKIDYIISGCRFSSNTFKNSFWYDGEILEFGTPRIEYLRNNTINRKYFIDKIGLRNNKKYLLYAPTFRKGNNISAYNIDYKRLEESLSQKFGGEWIILIKLHPNIKDLTKLKSLPQNCINVTEYNDIQELLIISDILLTDYSSCMFDAAFINKLCILFASDYNNYITTERELYFHIEKLPFPIAKNNDELENIILNLDKDSYNLDVSKFLESIGSFEQGNTCENIYNHIFINEN